MLYYLPFASKSTMLSMATTGGAISVMGKQFATWPATKNVSSTGGSKLCNFKTSSLRIWKCC